MANKFNLAALMGEPVSNLDTMRVQEIALPEIEENAANTYAQTNIDELAESIEVIGLQQPLVVRRKPEGGYLLLAGHRRRNALALLDRKTAPCIVLDADLDPSRQTLILHWTNTMARGGGGLTAQYTAQAAKEIETALKDLQSRGEVELPGKLRQYVAEVLKTSESQIARAKAIDKGLTKAWAGDLKCKRINESTAYELSQLDADFQRKLHGIYGGCLYYLDAKKVRAHRKAAEHEFAPLTCPEEAHPKQPCTGADKRAAAVKRGECPGCCHECEQAERCNNVCGKVKQRIKRQHSAEEHEAKKRERIEAFNASPLAAARINIVNALMDEDICGFADIEDFYRRYAVTWLWAEDPTVTVEPRLEDLFALAEYAGIDPFVMICGKPAESVWHKLSERKPPEGAQVLCSLNGCAGRYGEFVYRGGRWYFPELDDAEANVSVRAWTEVLADEM